MGPWEGIPGAIVQEGARFKSISNGHKAYDDRNSRLYHMYC